MIYPDFKEYLEKTTGYEVYMQKALALQHDRNRRRSDKKGKKWNEAKMERAAYEMWEKVVLSAYEQIKAGRKAMKAGTKTWIEFMNENEFVESFNDGISEMEFE